MIFYDNCIGSLLQRRHTVHSVCLYCFVRYFRLWPFSKTAPLLCSQVITSYISKHSKLLMPHWLCNYPRVGAENLIPDFQPSAPVNPSPPAKRFNAPGHYFHNTLIAVIAQLLHRMVGRQEVTFRVLE